MDNNINEETHFSFLDLVKPLKGRGRAILSLAIIASLLGGVIGLIVALCTRNYGSQLQFKYSPYAESLDLIYVLNTESFAERLLLDENGLPPRSMCDAESYDKALAAIQKAEETRQAKRDAYEKYKKLAYELNFVEIEREYKYLEDEYTRLYEKLELYKSAAAEAIVDENHLKVIAQLETEVAAAWEAYETHRTDYYRPAYAQVSDASVDLSWASIVANEAKREAESLREAALKTWRSNKDVKHNVNLIMNSISFKYTYFGLDSDEEEEQSEDALVLQQNLSLQGGYITVSVNMPNDSKSSEYLVETIKTVLPDYVEEVLEYSADVYTASCTLLSPFSESAWTNLPNMFILPLVFIVAFNIVVICGYCTVIIVKSRARSADEPAPSKAKPDNAVPKKRLPYKDAE